MYVCVCVYNPQVYASTYIYIYIYIYICPCKYFNSVLLQRISMYT